MNNKFVIYNPHCDDFLFTPVHFSLIKRKALTKYDYLVKGLLDKYGVINILIDNTQSSLLPDIFFTFLPEFFKKQIVKCEVKIWRKINNAYNFNIHFKPDYFNRKMILFMFSYKACTGNFGAKLNSINYFSDKIVHLSHYFVNTNTKAKNIIKIKNVILAGDADIHENYYFKHFFSWYKKNILVLPFSLSSRFVNNVAFESRINKCVATGSFHKLSQEIPKKYYEDFMKFFHLDTYHPERKYLFENKNTLGMFDVFVAQYRPYGRSTLLHNYFLHFNVMQKKYFNIDIVKLYNQYKFALIGEEITGFPAIGSIEAIACGCVLLGKKGFYESWGLIADTHFIEYENIETLTDSYLAKIKQNYNLKKISNECESYIREHFSNRRLFEKFEKTFDEK